jgi:cell wall-associated NlpC family hydrolase
MKQQMLLLALSVGFLNAVPTKVMADNNSDIKSPLSTQKREVDQRIRELKEELVKKETEIKQKKRQFEATRKQIRETDEKLKETRERVKNRQQLIDSRLHALQTNSDSLSNLTVPLDSNLLNERFQRAFVIHALMEEDMSLMETQKKDYERLNKQKKWLENREELLRGQSRSLQENYAKLKIRKAEQEALSKNLGDRLTVLNEAIRYLGYPYHWGGANPESSFDCSGLVQWSFKKAGIELPRTAAQQYLATRRLEPSDVKPGDLVFFSFGKRISHVGIYVGNGQMINAQNSGVKVASLQGYWKRFIAGFGRVAELELPTDKTKKKTDTD